MPQAPDTGSAKAGEHILTCLSGAPSNGRVIRAAAKLAAHGELTALYVQTPGSTAYTRAERDRFQANLRLAEQLGARITTVYGDDPAVQIAEYARLCGISKVVLGVSPARRPLASSKSLVDRLSDLSPTLDIYLVPGSVPARPARFAAPQERFSLRDIARAMIILALCTVVGYLFRDFGLTPSNIIMVYLLGVLGIAMVTTGRSYSLLSSILSVLIFNFFFTAPYYSLISDRDDFATFGVMFLAALLSSSLTTRIKRQAIASANQAYRTEVLLETSQKLQKTQTPEAILTLTATQLQKLLERDLLLYPVEEDGALGQALCFPPQADGAPLAAEREIACWVQQHGEKAGATTDAFPDARCLYMAVRGFHQVQAVAAIVMDPAHPLDAYIKSLMVAIADEAGLALEKDRAAREKRKAEETAQQEALRANLLRTISHDLRTPLTSISGFAGLLMERGEGLDAGKKGELYASIYDNAQWLIRLVENLLSITRMENGAMALDIQPQLVDDVFSEALAHIDRGAQARSITVALADDLLMAEMDARLIVQVLINLLNNAIKYTPAGSYIVLAAARDGEKVTISVTDDGPGIPEAAIPRLFEMFYTVGNDRGDGRRGLGLGLALCRSIVDAHGGQLCVANHPPHGAVFSFQLCASEVVRYE